MSDLAIIVLAAGKGTRMKSALPKVLHKAAGRSLLGHVLHTVKDLAPTRTVVVSGPGPEAVGGETMAHLPGARVVTQEERKGTGHAVAMAKQALDGFDGLVVVLYADCPLVRAETVREVAALADPMSVLAFTAANPCGYGRLIRGPSGDVSAIREELDASPEERRITLCNSGIIAIQAKLLWDLLPKLTGNNAKGELYLTDLVELAVAADARVRHAECPEAEVAGVNDRVQLAVVEAAFQERYRRRFMLEGVTLVAPDTVHFSADTIIGTDVTIEPHVIFGPGVSVADNVDIRAFSHIAGARLGQGSKIGPFARLRSGAEIGADAHIGNFVEVKNTAFGKGAKANHLNYVGDAKVGAGVNIGAGAITCNYDGYEKHVTEIGANVFVGSNTALVAPVKIGDGAFVAAGSVVTKDVPPNALAITRPELQIREGWAVRYREMKSARKAAKAKGKE